MVFSASTTISPPVVILACPVLPSAFLPILTMLVVVITLSTAVPLPPTTEACMASALRSATVLPNACAIK